MAATLLTYEGKGDAIRFGIMRFSDGTTRRFLYDRLTKRPRLFFPIGRMAIDSREDNDPVRLEDAIAALTETRRYS